jgi:hypothetical protein
MIFEDKNRNLFLKPFIMIKPNFVAVREIIDGGGVGKIDGGGVLNRGTCGREFK